MRRHPNILALCLLPATTFASSVVMLHRLSLQVSSAKSFVRWFLPYDPYAWALLLIGSLVYTSGVLRGSYRRIVWFYALAVAGLYLTIPLVLEAQLHPNAWWDYRLPDAAQRIAAIADLSLMALVALLWIAFRSPKLREATSSNAV
jgi:hypothetical protein